MRLIDKLADMIQGDHGVKPCQVNINFHRRFYEPSSKRERYYQQHVRNQVRLYEAGYTDCTDIKDDVEYQRVLNHMKCW